MRGFSEQLNGGESTIRNSDNAFNVTNYNYKNELLPR